MYGENEMNVLILTADETSWQKELKESYHINAFAIYRYRYEKNYIKRGLRKLHSILPLPGYQIWFGDWWKNLQNVDVIIAIAYKPTYRMFKMIKKKYPHIRQILYWWDPVSKTISPDNVSESICEKWTFSKKDATRFHLNYNP